MNDVFLLSNDRLFTIELRPVVVHGYECVAFLIRSSLSTFCVCVFYMVVELTIIINQACGSGGPCSLLIRSQAYLTEKTGYSEDTACLIGQCQLIPSYSFQGRLLRDIGCRLLSGQGYHTGH